MEKVGYYDVETTLKVDDPLVSFEEKDKGPKT